MKTYFIAATSTNIGKTFFTCALCNQFEDKAFAIKPIITGWDSPQNPELDTMQILQSLGMENDEKNINKISPFRFRYPLSPDMAARLENKKEASTEEVQNFCQETIRQQQGKDYLFIETLGGIFSPINRYSTMCNIIQAMRGEVILLTGNYLGSLSHTIATVTALKTFNIKIAAVIINETGQSDIPAEETKKSLKNFINEPISILPYTKQISQYAWQDVKDLGIF